MRLIGRNARADCVSYPWLYRREQRKRGEFERITLIVCHEARGRAVRGVRARFVQILSNLEAKDSLCWAIIAHDARSRSNATTPQPQARGQDSARCATGCARWKQPRRSPNNPQRLLPRRDRRIGADARRRAGADLGARDADLSRARRARQPLRALGAAQKLGKGDTVCLMMPNRPEYFAIWLGITSVGGVVVAAQHAIARAVARPLHRHRRAAARHRRRRIHRRIRDRPRSPARPKSGRMAAATSPASIARSNASPRAPLAAAERRGGDASPTAR